MVAIAAIAFAAFSFVSPENASENSNSSIAAATGMHQTAFPADITSAKCGAEDSKTGKTVKADTTKKVESKCGEGKCGTKDAKAAKKTMKSDKSKCGEGKCGTKDAKAAKKTMKSDKSKCGQGKCGVS